MWILFLALVVLIPTAIVLYVIVFKKVLDRKYLLKSGIINEDDILLQGYWLREKEYDYNFISTISNTSGVVVPGVGGVLMTISPFISKGGYVAINDKEVKFFLSQSSIMKKENLQRPIAISIDKVKSIYESFVFGRMKAWHFEFEDNNSLLFQFNLNKEKMAKMDELIKKHNLEIKPED